jgi:hypothetical protein
MRTCGNCLHYRLGKCRNRSASTYGQGYASNSCAEDCALHLNRIPCGHKILPFISDGVRASVLVIQGYRLYRESLKTEVEDPFFDF